MVTLIIIEAKKIDFTHTYPSQLTAYMGIVHANKNHEQKSNGVIYGTASDGLAFRFCTRGLKLQWLLLTEEKQVDRIRRRTNWLALW